MTDRHVDEAIDRAVREMMEVDPPAGLRARVMARVDQPPSRLWTWPRLMAIAAVPAALVLVVFLTRGPDSDTQPRTAAAGPQPPAPMQPVIATPQPVAGSAPSMAAGDSRPVAATRRRAGVADRMPGPVEPAAQVAVVTPLDRIAPVTIDPIAAPTIAPSPIVITPLDRIADLVIEPLPSRGERD
jgi:hypothetical protein